MVNGEWAVHHVILPRLRSLSFTGAHIDAYTRLSAPNERVLLQHRAVAEDGDRSVDNVDGPSSRRPQAAKAATAAATAAAAGVTDDPIHAKLHTLDSKVTSLLTMLESTAHAGSAAAGGAASVAAAAAALAEPP